MINGTTGSFEKINTSAIPKKQAKSYEIDLGQNVKYIISNKTHNINFLLLIFK